MNDLILRRKIEKNVILLKQPEKMFQSPALELFRSLNFLNNNKIDASQIFRTQSNIVNLVLRNISVIEVSAFNGNNNLADQ